MSRYAEKTTVSSVSSRNEIEATLTRYGASEFAYGWQEGAAMIGFKMESRLIKFLLPLPDRNGDAFRLTPTGKTRSPAQQEKEYEQSIRQGWRALALCIKAKLEAVEAGIMTFDEEFLSRIVLPGGQTFGERVIPQLESITKTGKIPNLLGMDG